MGDGDRRSPFDAIGENRRPAGPDGLGKQIEDAGKAGLGIRATGEDVESPGEERPLLVRCAVLGAARADSPIDEQGWSGNHRGAGGQPGVARVEHRFLSVSPWVTSRANGRRSTILHPAALLANPPSGSRGTPEVLVVSPFGCSG